MLVVLSRQETLCFKNWTVKDFSEVNFISVVNLTHSTTEILDVHLNKPKYIKTRQLSETKSLAETEINANEFRTVLMLILQAPSKQNVLDAIKRLEQRKDIISAEPDYILQPHTTKPNDTLYEKGSQWGLNGMNGINAPQAWAFTTGINSVKVGVIDSGIDAGHPDFQNVNGTGRINIGLSRDFTIASPYTVTTVTDTGGHGTHVTGIIGAVGNNGEGITGVAQNVELISLKIGDSMTHNQFASRLIQAVTHASANGIRILNNSNGLDNFTGSLDNITAFENTLRGYNGLYITSAGNSNRDNDANANCFPSNIKLSNLISVGSIDENGDRRSTSNWGATTVDVFAPGGLILSTYLRGKGNYTANNNYQIQSGTSMAAPHVTGIAALMLSVNSTLTGAQLKATIMNNAEIDKRYTNDAIHGRLCVSGGRVNAYKAVAATVLTTSSATGGISITGFRNGFTLPNNTNLTLPDSFAPVSDIILQTQQTVTAIGSSAFSGCSQLSKITIPAGVMIIGANAFKNCSSVTIYPEANAKSCGWDKNWNSSNRPIVWGNIQIEHRDNYLWKNGTQHHYSCTCGYYYNLQGHIVTGGNSNGGISFSMTNPNATPKQICLLCGGPVDIGFIQYGVLLPIKILSIEQVIAPDGLYYPIESFYIGDILVLNYNDNLKYNELKDSLYCDYHNDEYHNLTQSE